MFLSSSSLRRPLLLQNENKSKDEIAFDDLAFHFNNELQTIMKNAGFDFVERGVYHRSFLDFMHATLLYLARNIRNTKCSLSLGTTEEEENALKRLKCNLPVQNETKINKAIKLMKADLPQTIRNYMLRAGFEQSETEESHKIYLSFVSNFTVLESEKMFRYKSRFTPSEAEVNKPVKKRKMETTSPQSHHDLNSLYEICGNKANRLERDSQCDASTESLHLITNTRKHLIYFSSEQKTVIKVLKSRTPLAKDIYNLDNEFKIAKSISHHAFRPSIQRTIFENKEALILQWCPGFSINQLESVTINDFLLIAREIVSSLLTMHRKQIMHMNLTSEHILFDPESKNINIIGCGSSISFNSKSKYMSNQELPENDLRYTSPEQTGRINRVIDYRSDFYSLGIIFYRLLTGKYPFESENAWELLHLQISKDPFPVHTFNSNIPVSVSAMVFKLMGKNADDRYQSTKGIMHDLYLMLSEYKNDEKLQSIVLGQHDVSHTLLIPHKLYGHSAHFQSLLSVFGRAQSSFEIVFVVGNSGSGKSALVHELYQPVIQNGGIYICGKYDFSSAEPYSALLEAFNNFCDDLLLKDEPTKANFKNQILKAVGDNGKILTNFITNLHSIIGEQPCISDAYGQEDKKRLHYVFTKFIKAICSVGQPIVLVLEDLQWMDVESLSLLSILVTNKAVSNLMLVGIYRDNEVTDDHLVTQLTHNLERAKRKLTLIKIENMGYEDINELLSDALSLPPLETYALTAMFHAKTNGNPFFVKHLLKHLSDLGSIFFCNSEYKWKWDVTMFGEKDLYENVKQLLRLKILSFDEHTQQVLKVASCIGSSFSIRILKLVVNRSEGILGAISSDMIVQCKGSDTMYNFVHDNIQEAAYSLLPDNPRPMFSYIGKKLWTVLSKQELHENIFTVVRLLHGGVEMSNDEEDRYQVVELFLQAGEKAMKYTGFAQSCEYLEAGMKLLGEDGWNTQYDLCLKLYDISAKALYCMSNYTKMYEIIAKIFKNVTAALDLVPCYLLLIRMNSDMRRNEEAIRYALIILEKLDVSIDPNQSIGRSELMQTKSLVGESMESILEIREMENRTILSSMEILNFTLYSCFNSDNFNLYATVCSKMVELTMKHGISKYSCHGLCSFAVVLSNNGDKSSYDFGKLALKLLEKSNSKEMLPMVNASYFCFISPVFDPMHSSIEPMARMTCISLEIGSHHYSSCCAAAYCVFTFFCGEELSKTIDEICHLEDVLIRRIPLNMAIHQAMLNLHDSDIKDPAKMSGDKFDSKFCFDKDGAKNVIVRTSLICCIIAYLFYDYEAASKFIEICKRDEEHFGMKLFKAMFHFYDGLVASSISRNIERKEKYMKIIEENIINLKHYAENAPMNYLNKARLLEAELAVLHKNEAQAKSLFQKAISLSKKHGFVHEQALACERFATFYLELESQPDATELLLQSYNCYKALGAESKMLHLIKRYPFLAAVLKTKTSTLDKSDENLKVDNDSADLISEITDLSSPSASTWQYQKQVRLSITK